MYALMERGGKPQLIALLSTLDQRQWELFVQLYTCCYSLFLSPLPIIRILWRPRQGAEIETLFLKFNMLKLVGFCTDFPIARFELTICLFWYLALN